MSRSKGLTVASHDVGVLVLLESDPVAGAVDEVLAVAPLGDDAPGHRIHVLARGADHGGVDGGSLGLLEDQVEVAQLGGWFAGVHAAGDVGAVAVGHGASEVAQDDLPGPDHPGPGIVVRAGGVGPGSHDGEVDGGVALGQEPSAEVGRHLSLGAPDHGYVPRLELRRHPVRSRRRSPQRSHLGGVLDRPQCAGHRARRRPAGTGEPGLQLDQEAGPGAIAHRHGAGSTRQLGHQRHRVIGLVPGAEVEHLRALDHPRRLQARHDHGGVALDGDHEHGEALERHGPVTGQPGQVGAH